MTNQPSPLYPLGPVGTEILIGSEYEATKDLDITEISKLMRKAIREEFVAIKVSVTVKRLADGDTIDVVVKGAPFEINPIVKHEEWIKVNKQLEEKGETPLSWKMKFSPKVRDLMERLLEVHDRWNWQTHHEMDNTLEVRYGGSLICGGLPW